LERDEASADLQQSSALPILTVTANRFLDCSGRYPDHPVVNYSDKEPSAINITNFLNFTARVGFSVLEKPDEWYLSLSNFCISVLIMKIGVVLDSKKRSLMN
jgi:hypothetical protein